MVPTKKRIISRATETVEIDDQVKDLLIKGARKAGTQAKLAEILGYSVPSNMVFQLLSAPKYKRKISVSRLKRLREYVERGT